MRYDFTTVVNRHAQGSEKWAGMKKRVPNLPNDIIPFSVADMEFLPAPEITDGLIDYLRGGAVLGYTVPTESYVQAVTGWMALRHGWRVEGDSICVSNGIIPALFDLVKAYTQPGDGVILMTPVYYPFYNAVTANGRTVVECPLVNDGTGYRIDYNLLVRLTAQAKNKLLIFCSPHNPVGRVWSEHELREVADVCIRNNVVIVSDEIHHDLIMPGHRHTVMASLSDEIAQHVITCTAPSKTFNLAGMLASNIIIKNPSLREAYRTEQYRSGFDCMGALGYKACELAYTRGEAWLTELIALVQHNYDVLCAYLREHLPRVKVYPMEGTYLAWMDFSALGMGKDELETFMVEKAHVFMDEGYIFGEAGSGFERMNLACPTGIMLEALTRIVNAMQ